MKKIIITLLVLVLCMTMMPGCTTNTSADENNATESLYEREETKDYFRCVYVESNMTLWVNTLDNSVWITYNTNSIAPYIINGKTVFWRGSMEETFSYNNLK